MKRAMWGLCAAAIWLIPCDSEGQTSGRVLLGGVVQTYVASADDVDGALPAVGITTAVRVNPLLDFEAEFVRPVGTLRREHSGYAYSFAPPGSPREDFERYGVFVRFLRERRVDGVLSFGAAFHPRPRGSRLEPRLFAGVTTHFARERDRNEPLSWSPLLTPAQVATVRTTDTSYRRTLGSLTIGGGIGFRVAPNLVVMPDARYDYGSIGDEINNSFRAGMRCLWRF